MNRSITVMDLWLAASGVAFILGVAIVAGLERAQPGLGKLATILGEGVVLLREIARAMKSPAPTGLKEPWWEDVNRRALGRHEVTDEFRIPVAHGEQSPGEALEQYWLQRGPIHEPTGNAGFTISDGPNDR